MLISAYGNNNNNNQSKTKQSKTIHNTPAPLDNDAAVNKPTNKHSTGYQER